MKFYKFKKYAFTTKYIILKLFQLMKQLQVSLSVGS